MSKIYFLILLFFLLFSHQVQAQEEASVDDKLSSLKFSVISPSFSYGLEKRLSDKGVIEVEGGLWGMYRYDKYEPIFIENYPYEAQLITHTFKISPFINIGYKNYYNIKNRANLGKSIEGNAANYFGISLLNTIDGFVFRKFKIKGEGLKSGTDRHNEFGTKYSLFVVPKWGFQRNIKGTKYQYFAEVCPHILADVEDTEVDIQLQMGIKLRL